MEQFYPILWSAISVVATGLSTWLVATITNFFNSKIKDKKMQQHAENVLKIIESAVKNVTQTYVDTLKKQGKFDEKAQATALEMCYKVINANLTQELKEYITNNFGDIATYIKTQIEATIYNLK